MAQFLDLISSESRGPNSDECQYMVTMPSHSCCNRSQYRGLLEGRTPTQCRGGRPAPGAVQPEVEGGLRAPHTGRIWLHHTYLSGYCGDSIAHFHVLSWPWHGCKCTCLRMPLRAEPTSHTRLPPGRGKEIRPQWIKQLLGHNRGSINID